MRRSRLGVVALLLVVALAGAHTSPAIADDEPFSFIVGWGGPIGSGDSTLVPNDQIIPTNQWIPLIWGNRVVDEFGTDRGLDGVSTTVLSASAGVAIGATTVIRVADTRGFPDPAGRSGGDAYEWAMWQRAGGDLQVFRYSGMTPNSLTGVTLGSTTIPMQAGDRIAPAPVSIYGIPAEHDGDLQQGVVNVLWERDPTASGVRLLRQSVYDGLLDIPWFHSDEMAGRNTDTQWQHMSFQPGELGSRSGRFVVEVYQSSGSDLRVQGVPARSPLLTMAGFSTSDGSDPGDDRLEFASWTRTPWRAGTPAGFRDVSIQRQTEAVDWAYTNGITTGVAPGLFGPERFLTRGEGATMLWRMADQPDPGRPHRFGDVVASWQQHAVSWMAETGITTGTALTTFAPNDILTRGQAATLLHRFVGSPAAARPHPFGDVVASWQQDAVSWMAQTGITTGTTPTTFAPDDPVTRGDFAVLLHRVARYFQPGL